MRSSVYLLLLTLIAPLAGAQSLAEVAEQEKERRASNDESIGPVKVYTNDDIDEDVDSVDPAAEPDEAAEPPADDDGETDLDEWLEKKQAEKEAWLERLADYRARFNEQKERHAILLAAKAQCESSAMPVENVVDYVGNDRYLPQVTWGVGNVTCQKLPAMIADTETTMRAIEAECQADARRHFIPISEARLR